MKFDYIIMNPPYKRNLHLKILEKAIEHLKDDGICVNFSPIRWLQDITATFKEKSDFKKYKNSIRKYINNIDIVYSKNAEQLFDIALPFNLGIYKCSKSDSTYFELDKTPSQKLTIKLLSNMTDNLNNHVQFSIPNNWAIVLSMICGGCGNKTEDATGEWFNFKKKTFNQYCYHNNLRLDNGLTYYENRKNACWGNNKPRAEQLNIQFNSKIEAEHFYNSCNTTFFKFVFKTIMVDVHVHPEFLPWMGEAINPRTRLKGYESEWTNEDFYTFFNITPDEQHIIEETMKKYEI